MNFAAKENPLLKNASLILVWSCMAIVLFVPIRSPFYYYDEGFAVFNATRVIGGDIPYKDFWAIYPPGQVYILATLFWIFGISLCSS